MRKLLTSISLIAFLGLGACGGQITKLQTQVQSQLVQPVAASLAVDANSAATLAANDKINPTGAASRAPCYSNAAGLATGLAGSNGGLIFLPVEGAIEGQELATSPACNAVVGQIMVNLLQKSTLALPIP